MRAEFPALDFAAVYRKFADHHARKGTETVTPAMLRGWFKRERPASPATVATPKPEPKQLPKLQVYGNPWEEGAVWKAGAKTLTRKMIEALKTIGKTAESDIHRTVCDIVGTEFDVIGSCDYTEDGDREPGSFLYEKESDGFWYGAEIVEIMLRQKRELKKAAEKAAEKAAAHAKRKADENARVEAERGRKENEDAEQLKREAEEREVEEFRSQQQAELAAWPQSEPDEFPGDPQ